jgi:hypothetical protein
VTTDRLWERTASWASDIASASICAKSTEGAPAPAAAAAAEEEEEEEVDMSDAGKRGFDNQSDHVFITPYSKKKFFRSLKPMVYIGICILQLVDLDVYILYRYVYIHKAKMHFRTSIFQNFPPAELPAPDGLRLEILEYTLLFFLAHPHVGRFDLKPGEQLGLATNASQGS